MVSEGTSSDHKAQGPTVIFQAERPYAVVVACFTWFKSTRRQARLGWWFKSTAAVVLAQYRAVVVPVHHRR